MTLPSPPPPQPVPRGASLGGWLCLLGGLLAMFISWWLFLIYLPLFLASIILAIVALTQRRLLSGIALLTVTLVAVPVTWYILTVFRGINAIEHGYDHAYKFIARNEAPDQPARPVESQEDPTVGWTYTLWNAQGGAASDPDQPATVMVWTVDDWQMRVPVGQGGGDLIFALKASEEKGEWHQEGDPRRHGWIHLSGFPILTAGRREVEGECQIESSPNAPPGKFRFARPPKPSDPQ